MGHLLDIVPNHMAIDHEKSWWWDVLENGPSSAYAEFFDVDWEPPERRIHICADAGARGSVRRPARRRGKLKVVRTGHTFEVHDGNHVFPVGRGHCARFSRPRRKNAVRRKWLFLADGFDALPSPASTDLTSINRRHRDKKCWLTCSPSC